MNYPDPGINTLTLERLKVIVGNRVSAELLRESTVEQVYDMALDQMAIRLRTEVLGHRLAHKQHRLVVEYPDNAWQHLKHQVWIWAMWARVFKAKGSAPGGWWARQRARIARPVLWWLRRHPVVNTAEATSVDFSEYATFPEATIAYPKKLGRVHFMQRLDLDGYPEPERERIWPTEAEVARVVIEASAVKDREGWHGPGAPLPAYLSEVDGCDSQTAAEVYRRYDEARRS